MFRIVIFCFVILAAGNASAQSYRVLPDDTLRVTAIANELTIFDIYQENLTQEPLLLGWRTVSNELPEGWDFSVCDLGSCYAGMPVGGEMHPTPVGEKAFLGLNIEPRGVAGTGVARIYVYDTKSPETGDTLTWIVDVANASVPLASVKKAQTYPNPFSRSVTLNFGQTVSGNVVVRDLSGSVVARLRVFQEEAVLLALPEAAPGVYIIEYPTDEGYRSVNVIKSE